MTIQILMDTPDNNTLIPSHFLGVDILLGIASIPFTVALSTDPSLINVTPVLVAGFAAGLYYETQSRSVRRAGFRAGLLGGVPVVWSSVNLFFLEMSASPDRLALVILLGTVWFLFALAVTALLTALCGRIGGWTYRKVAGTAYGGD